MHDKKFASSIRSVDGTQAMNNLQNFVKPDGLLVSDCGKTAWLVSSPVSLFIFGYPVVNAGPACLIIVGQRKSVLIYPVIVGQV